MRYLGGVWPAALIHNFPERKQTLLQGWPVVGTHGWRGLRCLVFHNLSMVLALLRHFRLDLRRCIIQEGSHARSYSLLCILEDNEGNSESPYQYKHFRKKVNFVICMTSKGNCRGRKC